MELRYQRFLLIALFFFSSSLKSQDDFFDDTFKTSAPVKKVEEVKTPEKTQPNNPLQYEDLPNLPTDVIKTGNSATLQEPLKKLRFRSLSESDLEQEKELRTRQR